MRMSRDHILTSQAGSLPRPDDLISANAARESDPSTDERAFQETLQKAIVDVVRKQKDIGIDVPGDGEFGKSMGHKVNYRAWWSYCFNRLGGLDLAGPGLHDAAPKRAKPGEVVLTSFADRRDRTKFLPVYQDPDGGVYTGPPMAKWPVCTGPVVYKGHDAIKADIAHFKAALKANGVEEGFMTSVAPGSASRLAQRLLQERRRVHVRLRRRHARGIQGHRRCRPDPAARRSGDRRELGHDQPGTVGRGLQEILDGAGRSAQPRHPRPAARPHPLSLCWGSWHGPHTTDIPMRDIVDVMLAINAQAYSFEAGNVRHEHEWTVWQDVKLPDGKLILPGVVSHATNVVEHPELVAQRIVRFTNLRRPRARHRFDRLRARRPHPPHGRLGQARSAGAGRGAGEQAALALIA